MKRWLILLGLLFSTNCFAATISISPFISGNDVTIANLESFRSTVQNVINGNIEGGLQNIKAGSITSTDLAAAINPTNFRDEAFNDWTFTGMLPPTSANLSATISAGTSYINGVRVVTAATAHTFTASKDTYTYINAGGFFDYVEVANGAAAPSTPANDLLLAIVISNGTAITSVTDSRTLSIQITANSSNFAIDYRNQAVVSMDSTTAVHIEPGQIAIGSTAYTLLADSASRSTATASNWIEGSVPNKNNLKFYVYAYNNSGTTFDFKYASAEPAFSDTSSNTGGTLQYYAAGGVNYRLLAWISADQSGNIQSYNYSNFPSSTTKNMTVFQTGTTQTCATTIPADNTIPQSNEGNQVMQIPFRPSNANSRLKISIVAVGSGNNAATGVTLFRDLTSTVTSALAASDSVTSADGTQSIPLIYYMTAGTTNMINFTVRFGSASANAYFNGISTGQIYGGTMNSMISVEEITD